MGTHDSRIYPRLRVLAVITTTVALAGAGVVQAGVMTAADFDGDGFPDLALISDGEHGSLVTAYPGTGDRVRPFGEDGIRSRFPEPIGFAEAGDFDADGYVDLLVAAPGQSRLVLLAGDGTGRFREAARRQLSGEVSVLATGDLNRRDGLVDIAVAIDGLDGSVLLVYESPRGAFAADPEVIELDALDAATALAIGEMDGEPGVDLSIVVGDELILVHGRDRRTSLGPHRRLTTPPRIDRFSTPGIRAMAFRDRLGVVDAQGSFKALEFQDVEGDWELVTVQRSTIEAPDLGIPTRLRSGFVTASPGSDWILSTLTGTSVLGRTAQHPDSLVAVREFDISGPVLAMRVNGDALDDLVFVDPLRETPLYYPSQASAIFVVDDLSDAFDASPGDGACADLSGRCTFRAAIEEANALPGPDGIEFDLGPGTPALVPVTELPAITEAVTIDGATGGATRILLDGAPLAGASGLVVAGDGVAIHSMEVTNYDGDGIRLESANNVITDCESSLNRDGIRVTGAGANGNTIGGASISQRNVIALNLFCGVRLEDGAWNNTIAGNQIGSSEPTGDTGVDTGICLEPFAHDNTIGGIASAPGEPPGNVIHGHLLDVDLDHSYENLIQGNLIGLDSTGSTRVGAGMIHLESLIIIDCSPFCKPPTELNTIGGPTVQMRNVLGSVRLYGDATADNLLQGNYFCTDVSGTVALGGSGVLADSWSGNWFGPNTNVVGGNTTAPGVPPGNVISGCTAGGVTMFSYDDVRGGADVLGNLVGLAPDGTSALPNAVGIEVKFGEGAEDDPDSTIGGPDPGDRNVISGNLGVGVLVEHAEDVTIQGNWIGLDANGAALPNGAAGVEIHGFYTRDNRIEGNVVSGNLGDGVKIHGSDTLHSVVVGNFIGLAPDGVTPRGNGGHGVLVSDSARFTRIGDTNRIVPGDCAGECNRIAHNAMAGIRSDGLETEIRGNAIHGNGGLGIDVAAEGVTPNDPGDVDPPNFPVIDFVTSASGSVTVGGGLSSRPGETFTIEVFGASSPDPSDHGEGDAFVGATTCATDASGFCAWSVGGPFTAATYTATSTGSGPWTSEFAANLAYAGPGEASGQGLAPLRVEAINPIDTVMAISYGAPCGASDHNIEWGLLDDVSAYGWAGHECGIGTSGSYLWNYPDGDLFFVVVANNHEVEGSYGIDGDDGERPEDVSSAACPWPRELFDRCDP